MVTFEQIATFAVVLCAIFGAVILINNTRKAVDDLKKPFAELVDMVKKHDAALAEGDNRMDKQDRAIDLLLRSNKLMMQHMAYGNHNEQLKDMCDKFDQFLIEERQ